ncbi:MAG: hypothetical protein GF334_10440 [Candidatus Altiarchaeales archaeon]|nr:hypothetical protein [Candidatus Altiarchaeales archaeon]
MMFSDSLTKKGFFLSFWAALAYACTYVAFASLDPSNLNHELFMNPFSFIPLFLLATIFFLSSGFFSVILADRLRKTLGAWFPLIGLYLPAIFFHCLLLFSAEAIYSQDLLSSFIYVVVNFLVLFLSRPFIGAWRGSKTLIGLLFLFTLCGWAYTSSFYVLPCGDFSQNSLSVLASLGYLQVVETGDAGWGREGVVFHDMTSSMDGLNLYEDRWNNKAYLMKNSGEVVHTWSYPPDFFNWTNLELDGEGNLYVISGEGALLKLDWNSNKIFKKQGHIFHHDVAVTPNNFYVLSKEVIEVPDFFPVIRLLSNSIHVYTHSGVREKKAPLYPIFKNTLSYKKYFGALIHSLFNYDRIEMHSPADVFHVNSVEVLEQDLGQGEKGDLLISLRHLDTIAIIDLDSNRIKWVWGENVLEGPHNPTILDNGNILVFDNGYRRCYSRVLEVNPKTNEVVWSYVGDSSESFFSATMSGSQKLENGNILVTESEKGHAFEITPEGNVVWDFWTPQIAEAENKRPTLFRMKRITPNTHPLVFAKLNQTR